MIFGIATSGRGQTTTPTSNTADAQTAPVVIANYRIPETRFDWSVPPLLRTCQAVFEAAVVQLPAMDRPSKTSTTKVSGDTSVWNAIPESMVTTGRNCLRRLRLAELPPLDWPLALRLAIGVHDDTLVRAIVARQLAWADSAPGLPDTARTRQRAQVLENAILLLWQNQWNNDTTSHRTPVHDALARDLSAQLDTMRPSGLLFTTRLRVFDLMNAPNLFSEEDTIGDIAAQRVVVQQRTQVARSVDINTAPQADQGMIRGMLDNESVSLKFLDYLQTPTHDNFVAYLNARGPMVNPIVQLEGQHAATLHGDYWFNASTQPAPSVPAAGNVTLLIFLSAAEGRIPSERMPLFARVQQLHTQNPQLRIVWVVMTQGRFRDQDYQAHPEQEAEHIHQYLTDELQLPGALCVIKTQYHTEAGATAVPLASPMLDAYHLDPRDVLGAGSWSFLVDQNGWIVATGTDASGFTQRLLPRLLAR